MPRDSMNHEPSAKCNASCLPMTSRQLSIRMETPLEKTATVSVTSTVVAVTEALVGLPLGNN